MGKKEIKKEELENANGGLSRHEFCKHCQEHVTPVIKTEGEGCDAVDRWVCPKCGNYLDE